MPRVLVIDDESGFRNVVKHALSSIDFSVETAADAECGMEKFDHGIFDLVITDMRMPGADGHAVVSHIRQSSRKSTPVIGVSGTPWLLAEGDFDVVLEKPFSLKSLIEKAQSLIPGASEAAA